MNIRRSDYRMHTRMNTLGLSPRALRLVSLVFGLMSLVLIPIFSNAQEELRDVRPPVDIPEFPWIWVLVGGLIIGWLIWLWYSQRNNFSKKVMIKDPWIKAAEQLERLRKKDVLTSDEMKDFFSELSGVVRTYLEERFNIRAPEMTTQEFLIQMQDTSVLSESHKEILKDLLNTADMVKFARHRPEDYKAVECIDLVQKLINETKKVTTAHLQEKLGSR